MEEVVEVKILRWLRRRKFDPTYEELRRAIAICGLSPYPDYCPKCHRLYLHGVGDRCYKCEIRKLKDKVARQECELNGWIKRPNSQYHAFIEKIFDLENEIGRLKIENKRLNALVKPIDESEVGDECN